MPVSCLKVVACALAGLGATAVSASAADQGLNYQWSGASTSGINWSDSANWSQPGTTTPVAHAPGENESVGSLMIQLPYSASKTNETHNDVSGLTVNSLNDYGSRLTGNPLTLGAGGLQLGVGSDGHTAANAPAKVELPITLGANQTWTSSQNTSFQDAVGITNAVTGGVTGPDSTLAIGGGLALGGDNEVGDVTTTNGGIVVLLPGSKLNATDGHAVKASQLASYGGTVGALDNTDGAVQVGQPAADSSGSLSVASAKLGRSVSFALAPKTTGSTAGPDYGQLSSSGAVDITGAAVKIDKTGTLNYDKRGNPTGPGTYCGLPAPVGTVYTLISAAGGVTGTFANVYRDRLIKDACLPGRGTSFYDVPANQPNTYRIDYSANAVTATVVTVSDAQPYSVCVATGRCIPPTGPPNAAAPAGPSAQQVTAVLAKLGAPKGTSIRTLLKKGSFTYTVAAPAAGALGVAWYEVPKGAKIAKAKKPVLVAAGTKAATKAGDVKIVVKLTSAGKRTLKKAKRSIKLTDKASFAPTGGKASSKIATFKLKR